MKPQRKNSMTRVYFSFVLCAAMVFGGFQAVGQEWTDDEKQVWSMIETFGEFAKQGDAEAMSTNYYVMDSYEWWSSEAIPMDRKLTLVKIKQWFRYDKPISSEIEPLKIHIVGDVAIAFWTYKWKGNILSDKVRQIDIYVKQDNKWNYIGGMGCSCDKLPFCN